MESDAPPAPAPFYVETRPNDPQPTLLAARLLAAREQQLNGIQRSIRILQGGEVVDLKRF